MVKDDNAGHQEEVDLGSEVKSHFEKYKTAYITGGAGVVFASFTWLYMRGGRHAGVQSASDGPARVTMRPLSFLSSQSNIVDASENIVNVIEREGRGHPGYLTECIETGKKFLSQGDAAIFEGVSDVTMSNHMTGKLSDINGRHYRRLANLAVLA